MRSIRAGFVLALFALSALAMTGCAGDGSEYAQGYSAPPVGSKVDSIQLHATESEAERRWASPITAMRT
jgi:hypothetical protein